MLFACKYFPRIPAKLGFNRNSVCEGGPHLFLFSERHGVVLGSVECVEYYRASNLKIIQNPSYFSYFFMSQTDIRE